MARLITADGRNAPVRPGRQREPIAVQELLEWAFAVECASLDFDEFAPGRCVGIEAVLMEQARLGAKIDGGGWSPRATDAEIVAAVVCGMPVQRGGRRMAVMIAELARARQVPDWMPGAVPRLAPAEWKRASRHGGPMARTDVAGHWDEEKWLRNPKNPTTRIRRVKRHEIRFCPCRWTPSNERISAARRFYLDWWGALLHLQDALRSVGLDGFKVTSVMPPMTPWRDDR
ncbi:hypothetical protein [Tropicimonas marinistellae]|uniref:hypothetical protein n=1 Tax=Tropicimonas marinistellae TaxID=1739787 RepID=UPI00122E09A6|nr:hypothetical protein [Tropicimonas marinistellae]